MIIHLEYFTIIDRDELFSDSLKYFQFKYKYDVINPDIVIQFCKNTPILKSDLDQIFKDNDDLEYNTVVYEMDYNKFDDIINYDINHIKYKSYNNMSIIQYWLYEYIMKNM